MTELKEILQDTLINSSSVTVTINCDIPDLILRITDSRQMIYYGVDSDRQQGFTLNIDINENSKTGRRIKEKLDERNLLAEFKSFKNKNSIIYLRDFGVDIGLIDAKVDELLKNIDTRPTGQQYDLTFNRTDGNYRLE